MNAIFQIIRKTENEKNAIVLGTAFAIKTDNISSNIWYLLTAYHTISELLVKEIPIIVMDEDENPYSAQVIYPKAPLNEFIEYGLDFALLTIQTNTQFDSYYLKSFDTPTDCIVRGTSNYYDTIFRSLKGCLYYNEKLVSKKEKVMQLTLDTKSIFENSSNGLSIIDQKFILNGLSGAPILVEFDGEQVCAGIVSNIFPDMSASYTYGVPINTVITKCLEPLGIPFSFSYLKSESKRQDDNFLVLSLMFNNPESFSLEDYHEETKLWNTISNLFYRNSNILYSISKIIYSETNEYSVDAIMLLRYFYARLLFKMDQNNKALTEFANIKKEYNKISNSSKERLDTLISVRSIIESKHITNVDNTLDKLQRCGEKINNLSFVDELYKDNEAASMYGRGLTNLFSIDYSFSTNQKKIIKNLLNQHKELINLHPNDLCNQNVVSISLSWLLNIWKIDSITDNDLLHKDIINGFCQSFERKNSIFYVQSVITLALEKLISNQYDEALFLIILSSRLTYRLNLSLSHEGIKQLLLFLRKKHPEYYAIFELSYRYSKKSRLLFLNKANIQSVKSNVANALELVEEFENVNFNNKFDYYKVSYDKLMLYL